MNYLEIVYLNKLLHVHKIGINKYLKEKKCVSILDSVINSLPKSSLRLSIPSEGVVAVVLVDAIVALLVNLLRFCGSCVLCRGC